MYIVPLSIADISGDRRTDHITSTRSTELPELEIASNDLQCNRLTPPAKKRAIVQEDPVWFHGLEPTRDISEQRQCFRDIK